MKTRQPWLRLFFLAVVAVSIARGAGSIAYSAAPIGDGTSWLFKIDWVGDSASGAVPPLVKIQMNQFQLSGYFLRLVEAAPGSPAPSIYSLTITDPSGVDILAGAAASVSGSTAYSPGANAPPLDVLTVTVGGQSTPSARGAIYLFMSKPGAGASVGRPGSGNGCSGAGTIGQVATATGPGTPPPCNWQAVGNAATATALAANGTNCSAGSPPLGVDASGNAEGCAPLTAAQVVNAASINATNSFSGRQDATAAASTAPAKTGTSLPGTCVVGDLYFKSDATPAGRNIYECDSLNTWSQQSAGSTMNDCFVTRFSASVLHIFDNASASTPCVFRHGSTVSLITSPATATDVSGTFTGYVWVLGTTIFVGRGGGSVTCSGCTATGDTSFPLDSLPIWTWTSTGGAWDSSGGVDNRPAQTSKPSPISGRGVSITPGDQDSIATDATVVPLKFMGTSAPGSVAGSSQGDSFTNTSTGDVYACTNVGSLCNGVGLGQWFKINGSGGASPTCDYFDTTCLIFSEEFTPGAITGTTNLGQQRWTAAASGTAQDGYASFGSGCSGDVRHQGLALLSTGTTSASIAVISLNGTSPTAWVNLITTATSWRMQIIFCTDDNGPSVANTDLLFGLGDDVIFRPANFIGLRYSTVAHACTTGSNSTANFMLETDASSSDTCANTGVAVAASTWYLAELTGTPASVSLTIATESGGVWGAPSSAATSTTHLPSALLWPVILNKNETTANHRLYLDKWAFLVKP